VANYYGHLCVATDNHFDFGYSNLTSDQWEGHQMGQWDQPYYRLDAASGAKMTGYNGAKVTIADNACGAAYSGEPEENVPEASSFSLRYCFEDNFPQMGDYDFNDAVLTLTPTIEGKKVLFATTAPEAVKDKLVDYLEENFGCEVVGTTAHLSNRPLLREDMQKYMDKADVMLTQLKAAAVDVATKDAIAHGLEVVYCDNIPVPISDSYPDLAESVIKLVDSAIDDFNKSS
jgi:hypothetical protein